MFPFRDSALSVPPDFHGSASRAALLVEEQQGRSSSFQRPCSDSSDRDLIIERELASSIEQQHQQQQQGRHQPFLARTNNVIDMMPTIEQLLASFNDEQQRIHRRELFQATISPLLNRPVSTSIEARLAASIEHQQVYRAGSFQDIMPNIDQHTVASLLQAADAISPSFCFPSNLLTEHHQPSLMPSLDHDIQFLGQLQRDVALQAQLEIQDQAHKGHLVGGPLPSEVDRNVPVRIPAPPWVRGSREPFPGKLYRLLVEAERNGNENIISFTQDGRAFKIHSREKFITKVSPTYFRQAKISSFVRQLNFYGFEKVSQGPNRGSFSHPFFIRENPELLMKIQRIAPKLKEGSARPA
jgi:hypothetical protein